MILCDKIFPTSYDWRVKIEMGKKFPIKNELCQKLLFFSEINGQGTNFHLKKKADHESFQNRLSYFKVECAVLKFFDIIAFIHNTINIKAEKNI